MKALFAVAVLTCWSFAISASAETGIPSRIDDSRSDITAWVAADVAVQNGELRPEFFGSRLEDLRALAQENGRALKSGGITAEASERPCTSFKTQPPAEDFVPAETLDDLTQYGKTIVAGRVVAIREGFWYGRPASLLKLEGTWLKGQPAGAMYFVYHFAHIDTAEGPICSKLVGDSKPPHIGDRLIAFSYAPALMFDGGSVVVANFRSGVIYERLDGHARVPAALRPVVTNGVSAVDQVRRAVQSALSRSPER